MYRKNFSKGGGVYKVKTFGTIQKALPLKKPLYFVPPRSVGVREEGRLPLANPSPVWKVPPPLDTQASSSGCRARALALAQKRYCARVNAMMPQG